MKKKFLVNYTIIYILFNTEKQTSSYWNIAKPPALLGTPVGAGISCAVLMIEEMLKVSAGRLADTKRMQKIVETMRRFIKSLSYVKITRRPTMVDQDRGVANFRMLHWSNRRATRFSVSRQKSLLRWQDV